MRKTKIICTMGPSTEKGDTLKKLIEAAYSELEDGRRS